MQTRYRALFAVSALTASAIALFAAAGCAPAADDTASGAENEVSGDPRLLDLLHTGATRTSGATALTIPVRDDRVPLLFGVTSWRVALVPEGIVVTGHDDDKTANVTYAATIDAVEGGLTVPWVGLAQRESSAAGAYAPRQIIAAFEADFVASLTGNDSGAATPDGPICKATHAHVVTEMVVNRLNAISNAPSPMLQQIRSCPASKPCAWPLSQSAGALAAPEATSDATSDDASIENDATSASIAVYYAQCLGRKH